MSRARSSEEKDVSSLSGALLFSAKWSILQDENIISYLGRKYQSEDGELSIVSKLWMLVLILTIMFASLHQTWDIQDLFLSTSTNRVEESPSLYGLHTI